MNIIGSTYLKGLHLSQKALLILIAVLFSVPAANALNYTVTAAIEIVNPIRMSEVQPLNFASIEQPQSQVVVHVTTNGGVGNNTTADMAGSPSAGIFTITGSDTQSISIMAKDASTVNGMAFTAVTGLYDDASDQDLIAGASSLAAPGSAGRQLALGAELTIQPNIAIGQYAPELQLEISYE